MKKGVRLRTKALILGLVLSIVFNVFLVYNASVYHEGARIFEKITGRGSGGEVSVCIDQYINLSELPTQTVRSGRAFRIDINLTERESIYYPNLNFTDNSTLFDINSTTGEINFSTNDSLIGFISVNITAGNNACREPDDSMVLVINVQEANFAPVINLAYNLTMYEDAPFYFNMSNFTSDPDGNALKFYDNYAGFVIGEDSGIIDFTPDDSDIGNWTVRFSVKDPGELVDFQDVLVSIISVNDAPVLSAIGAKTAEINVSLNITLEAYDQDATDTLAFFSNTSWFLNSSGPINTNSNWADYTFTAIITNNSWVNETFSINVTANDSYGAQDSEIISFSVVRYNYPPNITSYYPLEKALTVYLGSCQLFNITKLDPDGTIPSTKWHNNNNESGTDDNLTFCPSNAGTYNITVTITDGLADDTESWTVTAAPVPPVIPPSTTPSGTGAGGAGKFCQPAWICTDWMPCQPGNVQERTCYDKNRCGYIFEKPLESQSCIYTEFPTCFDSILNQDEIAADCGGICKPCPTCDDGILNHGEEGIDCGGPCPVCKELLAPTEVKKLPVEIKQLVSNLSIYWVFWLMLSVLMLSMVRVVREIKTESLQKVKAKLKTSAEVYKVNKLLAKSYELIKNKDYDNAKAVYSRAKEMYAKLPEAQKAKITRKP